MRPMRALVLGAGYRGRAYSEYAAAHPEELEIVGVADPLQAGTIPAPRYWKDWRDCLSERPDADIAMITMPDDLHYEPALMALEAGYHLLLEKPISQTEAQCREVIARACELGRLVIVGHVLRYTRYFAHIKAIVDSGEIGDVVTVNHQESAGFWKIAHAYVRGIFSIAEKASPIILAKCSHDFDLFAWWLGRRCLKVSSFGSIKLFRPENAPDGSAARCADCPESVRRHCIWDAHKMYLEFDDLRYLFADSSYAAMRRLIRESPYGRCVYRCDNDVPDHQTVIMEFDGGATVTHTMTGFTGRNVRTTRISGTRGEIVGNGDVIDVRRFDGGELETGVPPAYRVQNGSRHGGGDFNLVAEMLRIMRRGDADEIRRVTEEALQSHVIAFAAERSRLAGGQVVEIEY